jgi:hypothetical protein
MMTLVNLVAYIHATRWTVVVSRLSSLAPRRTEKASVPFFFVAIATTHYYLMIKPLVETNPIEHWASPEMLQLVSDETSTVLRLLADHAKYCYCKSSSGLSFSYTGRHVIEMSGLS